MVVMRLSSVGGGPGDDATAGHAVGHAGPATNVGFVTTNEHYPCTT